MMAWISVCHWRRFQHYDPTKRQPPWIKNYTELLNSSEYLDLTAGPRSLLHGIWIAYASSQCTLKFDPVLLSRRLNLRVRQEHLDALVNAGFLTVVASKTLAEGYQDASARAHDVEVETEVEVEKESKAVTSTQYAAAQNDETNGPKYENGKVEDHDLDPRVLALQQQVLAAHDDDIPF